MSNYVSDVSDNSFEKDVLQSDKLVLVDFWAGWCPPCRMLAPTIEAVAEMYSSTTRVLKVDVDDNPAVSARYGIRSIPTLILFKGGKEEERVVGAASRESISRMIEKHVNAA
jgi:thioredoxin 1